MNSITTSTLLKSVLNNRALSSALALAIWIAAVMSGSAPVILVACLLIVARPFLYIATLRQNAGEKAGKPSLLRAALTKSDYRGTWADGHNSPEYASGRALA